MLSLVLCTFSRSPFEEVLCHAMGVISSRDGEQSK